MLGGSILSRLFGGGSKGLASRYGDDVAKALMPSATEAVTPKSRGLLNQLLTGVEKPTAINPNVGSDTNMLYNATTKALPANNLKNRVVDVGKSIESAGTKLKNRDLLGALNNPKDIPRANLAIKSAEEVGLPSRMFKDVSEIATGKEGIFSTMNRNILEHSDVSVRMGDDARTTALKVLKNTTGLKPNESKEVNRVINEIHDNLVENASKRIGSSRPSEMGEAFIADIHKAIQRLGDMSSNIAGKNKKQIGKIFNTYRRSLEDVIDSAGNLAGYAEPENINGLVDAIKGANLPPKLQQKWIGQIRDDVAKNGGLSYKSLRRMQADPVMWGQIARSVEEAPLRGGVGYNRSMLGGPLGEIANEVIGKPLSSAVGNGMQVVGRAGQLAGSEQGAGVLSDLTKYGAMGLGGLGVLNMLGAGGANETGGAFNPGAGNVDPNVMAEMASAGGEMPIGAGAMRMAGAGGLSDMVDGSPTDMFAGAVEPTIGGYNREALENAYVAALMDDNPKAAQAIATMIDMLDRKDSALAKANEKSEKAGANEAKIDGALNVIGTLENMFSSFGGAQGIIGGNITNALNEATGGGYNAKAAAYNDMVGGSLAPIIKAMGDSGNLSDNDMKRATNFIPKITDSPEKAKIKFEQLKMLLNNARQKG